MKYKIIILLFTLPTIISAQAENINKFNEMQNAFTLGLDKKGLEIGHQLISDMHYEDFRAKTLFTLSMYFLKKSLWEDIDKINNAYTLLQMYNADYPHGEYSQTVNKIITYLESKYQHDIQFANSMEKLYSERLLVENKLKFANELLTFNVPQPLLFFLETEQDQSGIELTNKYFDDIIINNPTFKEYGYYYKIISLFGNFWGNKFIRSGLFELKNDLKSKDSEDGKKNKEKIISLLNEMSAYFPSHTLTLDLHLICAKEFMKKGNNQIDSETLAHLQYILNNDKDQLGIRYLLVKEFVLNNTFESESR